MGTVGHLLAPSSIIDTVDIGTIQLKEVEPVDSSIPGCEDEPTDRGQFQTLAEVRESVHIDSRESES